MAGLVRDDERRRAAKIGRRQWRRRGARRTPPYATLHADMLLLAARELKGPSLGLLLLLHANTAPNRDTGRLEAAVPFAEARKALAEKPGGMAASATVAKAFADLAARGLIRKVREAVAPPRKGQAASGAAVREGRAAAWEVTHRAGTAGRTEWPQTLMVKKLRRPLHKLRAPNDVLRRDVAELSGAALKVLAFVLARKDRARDGRLLDATPEPLSGSAIADLLGVCERTAHGAIAELVEKGRLAVATPARGRMSGSYALGQRYRSMAVVPGPRLRAGGADALASKTTLVSFKGTSGCGQTRSTAPVFLEFSGVGHA